MPRMSQEAYLAYENSVSITINKESTLRLIVHLKITKRKGDKDTPSSRDHALQAKLVHTPHSIVLCCIVILQGAGGIEQE